MKGIKICLMLLFIVMLTACATMPFPKLTKQSSRRELDGFSLSTPKGDNWYVMQENSEGVFYAKDLKTKTNSFIIGVFVANLTPSWKDQTEFLNIVKDAKRADTDPKRFKIIEEDYNISDKFGKYCVKYHTKVEDHGASSLNGLPYLILEAWGYGVIHPTRNGIYYDVNYSERYKPGEEDSSLKGTGEEFINSFQFSK